MLKSQTPLSSGPWVAAEAGDGEWKKQPPPRLADSAVPAAPAGRLPRVTHGSRICTDRLCDNSRGGEALHARSPPAAAGSFQPRGR